MLGEGFMRGGGNGEWNYSGESGAEGVAEMEGAEALGQFSHEGYRAAVASAEEYWRQLAELGATESEAAGAMETEVVAAETEVVAAEAVAPETETNELGEVVKVHVDFDGVSEAHVDTERKMSLAAIDQIMGELGEGETELRMLLEAKRQEIKMRENTPVGRTDWGAYR